MFNNINDAARKFIDDLVTAGFADAAPDYKSQIADSLMQISDIFEGQLTAEAKATLPVVQNYNSIPDVLYRCLTAAMLAIPAPEDDSES